MCMNGVRTGMAATAVRRSAILKALTVGRSACTGVVAGATTPGAVGCRFGSTTPLAAATATSASASPFSPLPTSPRRGRPTAPQPHVEPSYHGGSVTATVDNRVVAVTSRHGMSTLHGQGWVLLVDVRASVCRQRQLARLRKLSMCQIR